MPKLPPTWPDNGRVTQQFVDELTEWLLKNPLIPASYAFFTRAGLRQDIEKTLRTLRKKHHIAGKISGFSHPHNGLGVSLCLMKLAPQKCIVTIMKYRPLLSLN
jgi:hypothetical protein